jgi:hypothetical protein
MLHPVLTDWQSSNRLPISVVYRRQRHVPANVRIFADFVAGLFPQLTPGDTRAARAYYDDIGH